MYSLSLLSPKDIYFPSIPKLASLSGGVEMEAVTSLGSKKRSSKWEGWSSLLAITYKALHDLDPLSLWSHLLSLSPSLTLFQPYRLLSFEIAELISTSGNSKLIAWDTFPLDTGTHISGQDLHLVHRQTSLPDHSLHSVNPIHPSHDHGMLSWHMYHYGDMSCLLSSVSTPNTMIKAPWGGDLVYVVHHYN